MELNQQAVSAPFYVNPPKFSVIVFLLLQYLFENGRIDNIFTEPYSRFMIELTKLLKIWEPTTLPNGKEVTCFVCNVMWACIGRENIDSREGDGGF